MGLTVVHPGTFSTVQDLGRVGYRAWGVRVGGAFDAGSAVLANALLANPPQCAVVELTLTGGVYETRETLALALTGAAMAAQIVAAVGVRPLALPCSFTLSPGERLILGGTARHARTYLAVKGGWQTPVVLGSRSQERCLVAGQILPAAPSKTPHRQLAREPVRPELDEPLRIVDGPDAERLCDDFCWNRAEFQVAHECSRMGIRLQSSPLPVVPDEERLSAPVSPGGVQVAGGRAIILGVACGTMGGYPLVAQVISADLDRVGQFRPGDRIRFRRIELVEARGLDEEARRARRASWQRIATLARDGGIELA